MGYDSGIAIGDLGLPQEFSLRNQLSASTRWAGAMLHGRDHVMGWKHDLEEAEAAEEAAEAEEKEQLEPVPPTTPKGPVPPGGRPLCLVSTDDYPQWRTVRSFKPPPHSSRSEQSTDGRRHRHRRYIRADGTTRTERSAPSARCTATSQHTTAATMLPAIVAARGSSGWADAYARRGTWESQLAKHASRQKAGHPPLWEKAGRAVRKHQGHQLGWRDAVKPWLVQMGTSPRSTRGECLRLQMPGQWRLV